MNCENVCMEQSNNSEEKMHQNLGCIYEDILRATLTSTIFKGVFIFLDRWARIHHWKENVLS